MVRECPVLLSNEFVTVVLYEKTKVQLPAVNGKEKTVCVELKDGKYNIVDKVFTETKTESVEKPKRAKVLKNEPIAKEEPVIADEN